MALADHTKAGTPRSTQGTPCSVATLLETLEGDELAALKIMLGTNEKRGWSQAEVYKALTAEGYEVGFQTINRHRANPQQCRCRHSRASS